MAELKRDRMTERRVLSPILLALGTGLLAGALALLGAGALVAALVARGSVPLGALNAAALAALFFAALLGGLLTVRKMGGRPLVWGLCAGGVLYSAVLLTGTAAYGLPALAVALYRFAAALTGGAAAGVLTASRKK